MYVCHIVTLVDYNLRMSCIFTNAEAFQEKVLCTKSLKYKKVLFIKQQTFLVPVSVDIRTDICNMV